MTHSPGVEQAVLRGFFVRERRPRFRFDVARGAFRNGQFRVGLIVLLLPEGWSITDEAARSKT